MVKKTKKQSENDQDYCPKKKNKYYRKTKKNIHPHQTSMTNSNKWTRLENEKFLIFIQNHKKILLCPNQRKEHKVFLQLSRFVETRSADQCRSHHQKMIKHHKDLAGIVAYLEVKLHTQSVIGNITRTVQKQQISFELNLEKNQNEPNDTVNPPENIQMDQQIDDIWAFIDQDIWLNKGSSNSDLKL